MGNDFRGEWSLVEDSAIENGTRVSNFTSVSNCVVGEDCAIWRFVNMYGCELGDEVMVGSCTEIQSGVTVGDRSRIQSHSFVCSLVTIGEDVFVGHGVTFTNDRFPPTEDSDQWEETVVHDGAVIGSNATLLPVEIGENALVGAGAVVTQDVPENAVVTGNPAKVVDYVE